MLFSWTKIILYFSSTIFVTMVAQIQVSSGGVSEQNQDVGTQFVNAITGQNTADNSPGTKPISTNGSSGFCLSRGPSCIVLKLCNLEIDVGKQQLSSPAGICAGGRAIAEFNFALPTSTLNIIFEDGVLTFPNSITGNACVCNACNSLCYSNPLSKCKPPPDTPCVLGSDPTQFNASVDTCIFYAPGSNCFVATLCRVMANGVSLGPVPATCIQGRATFNIGNIYGKNGVINFNLTNIKPDVGPGTKYCQCSTCAEKCDNITFIDCYEGSTGHNNPHSCKCD